MDPANQPNDKGAPAPWYPQEQAEYVTGKGWKNPGELLTSYVNLEKLMGADKAGRTIVMPKDDKDVDGMKAFRAKLGVPDSADKYEIAVPENDSGEFLKTAAGWFHELGIPKAAAQGLAERWNKHWAEAAAKLDADMVAESGKQLDKLKLDWGGEFDKRSAFARDFMKKIGWTEERMNAYEKNVGTANMLTDFYMMGSKIQEPGFAGNPSNGGGGNNGTLTVSKDVAKAKHAEILQNRISGAISDKEWAAGKKAEFERYAEIIHGG